jgi:uncharacterized membrane protein
MKLKRNYQFVQCLLDFFALFVLYLFYAAITDAIEKILSFNRQITAEGAELIHANPYPIIIWGVLAFMVFAAGVALPFIFKNKTKLDQRQFDMWVYGVYLIRVLVLISILEIMGKHLNIIMHARESLFSFQITASVVLIVFLVKFTQLRIRAAQPKSDDKPRSIIED